MKAPSTTASFKCAVCGHRASRVILVPAGQRDPRLTPETPQIATGVNIPVSDIARLSIDGGPITYTVGMGNESIKLVKEALLARSAAHLYLINEEFAPFYCPDCGRCYCQTHYPSEVVYDQGFFDSVWGTCPYGHARKLTD